MDRDTTPMQLNHPVTGPQGPPLPAPTPVRQIIPVPNKTPPEAKEGAGSGSSGAQSGSGNGSLGSTPREAAALAALRRFQAGRSTESLKAPAPAAGASAAVSPGTPTPTLARSVPESQSSARSPPISSAAGSSAAAPGPTSPTRGPAPALIPLYNPGAAASAGTGMGSPSPYFTGATNASTPLIDVRPSASVLPRSPFGQSSGSSAYFAHSQPFQSQSQGGLPRPGQLPPNLTDVQLGQLDRLTREAIDERLRVLEGVQSTVWRCVEDLTRLRSALPETGPGPLRLGGGGASESSREQSVGSSFGLEIDRERGEGSGSGSGGVVSVEEEDEGGDVKGKGKGKDVAESGGEERVVEEADVDVDVDMS